MATPQATHAILPRGWSPDSAPRALVRATLWEWRSRMVRIDEETLALLDFEYCISICPWEFFLSQCSAALDLYKRSGFQGFTPPYDISYRGLKLPRVSAVFGRSHLRREAGSPQVDPNAGGLTLHRRSPDNLPA